MTEQVVAADYVIPSVAYTGPSPFWLPVILPIAGASLAILAHASVATWMLDGFVTGIVLTIPLTIVLSMRLAGRAARIRKDHNYAWYRTTFPEHAHASGRVSCRHCGGSSVQARNLMNRTFMRAHVCAQCGTTLYFSAEQG